MLHVKLRGSTRASQLSQLLQLCTKAQLEDLMVFQRQLDVLAGQILGVVQRRARDHHAANADRP